jgi:hypothetical protein
MGAEGLLSAWSSQEGQLLSGSTDAEAANRRATDAQVLEDAERLTERQAKANADTVLARCRFVVVGHSYNLPARCSAGAASFL